MNLIDLQVNGYANVDFSSPSLTYQQVQKACRVLRQKGTDAFLATIVSSPLSVYERNIPLIIKGIETDPLIASMIIGFHLEGPFISPLDGPRGAHDPTCVIAGDVSVMKRLITLCGPYLKMITVAPEVARIVQIIEMAADHSVIVSMGHTLASPQQIEQAVEKGARCVTHLGNGISAMLDRTDNPIHTFLSIPGLYIMLIADGHHLPPPFIKMVIRTCGTHHTIITSDSAPLGSMPPGEYTSLGGKVVLESDGKLHIPSLGCLAGSSACLSECADFLLENRIASPSELDEMCFETPKALLDL